MLRIAALVSALPFLLAALARAQNVVVPTECINGFSAGRDEVIYTIPYTYDQVSSLLVILTAFKFSVADRPESIKTLSIIGSYKNLTWSGNPDNTVTLNGTNNAVNTARTYDLSGSHVIETILQYSKPPAPGPYEEVHNTALLTVPSAGNVQLYIPYDGTVVTSVCGGKACKFNFTAEYCASNATVGGTVLHTLHTMDAVTVGKFLGGANFTSCAALEATNASSTTTGTTPLYTAAADRLASGLLNASSFLAFGFCAWAFFL